MSDLLFERLRREKERRAQQSRPFTEAELAEQDRMIAISQNRIERGADIESATDQDGLTYDPRTGTYKNRNAIVEGYEPTRQDAFIGGAAQGTGMNWGDEAIGAMASIAEGADYGPLRREQARGRFERQKEAFPYTFGGAELAGNVATASMAAPLATGPTMASTAGRGVAIGAGEGFLYGSGQGEDLNDRLNQGTQYSMIGAGIGGASPYLVAGGRKAIDATSDTILGGLDHLTGRASQSRAVRNVAEALSASGKSADDVTREVSRAAAQGQPEYRVIDALGDPGARKASGIVRGENTPSAETIRSFLDQRSIDAKDRVLGFVDDAFDMRGKSAKTTKSSVEANRKAVEKTLFNQAAADAAPVDVREAVEMLDGTISQMSNSGIDSPDVVKAFEKLRKQLAGVTPDGDPTTLSDYQSVLAIWRQVRGQVDEAYKSGQGHIGEALKPIRDSLRQSLQNSSDLFEEATQLSRLGRGVEDAFDAGAEMSRRGRAVDNISAFNSLSEQQKRAARVGYGDDVSASIERNKALQPNPAREFASTKRQAEADAMAINPATFADQIARENTMYNTTQRALRGSQTATNQADQGAMGPLADVARAGRDAVSANFGQAASNAVNAVAPYLTGQNEPTRQAIARILLSSDPASALAPVIRQSQQRETTSRIIEALLRNQQRENVYSAIPR